MRTRISLFATCMLALCSFVSAQDDDSAELAKTVQNPLASLVSLPFQANYNNRVGEYGRTFFNMNIQPVIPYSHGKLNVITRTISQATMHPSARRTQSLGFGDTNFSMFFSLVQ